MTVFQVDDPERKQAIAREILEALPDWFGVTESREEYIRDSAGLPFFAAFDGERPIGFLCLKESGAFGKIRKYLTEEDGIVYGGSAGAIIFGKDLDSCNTDDENEVGLADHTGFNMIGGYSLLCHYTSRNRERTELSRKYLLELSKTKPVYAIPEEDTIYVEDGRMEFIGDRPYYEFTGGTVTERKIG